MDLSESDLPVLPDFPSAAPVEPVVPAGQAVGDDAAAAATGSGGAFVPGPEPSAAQVALVGAVREIEQHVAAAGWDRGITVFALVPTATILENEPNLEESLAVEMRAFVEADPDHLTSIPQDLSNSSQDLSVLLAQLVWPPAVVGMALTAERIVLPQAAEDEAPADPTARDEFLLAHPARQDVRLAVGVLRTGESWCAVRMRAHDSDDAVAGGIDLAPDLVAAALATFQ